MIRLRVIYPTELTATYGTFIPPNQSLTIIVQYTHNKVLYYYNKVLIPLVWVDIPVWYN